ALSPARQSILVFGKYRQRQNVDTVFEQGMHVFARGFTVDATCFGFAEMDLPGFLGEFVADIIRVLANLATQLPHLVQYLFLGVAQRHGNLLLATACRNGRRHQRFLDSLRIAYRARDQLHSRLAVEIGIVAKPALEFMALIAMKRKADHGIYASSFCWAEQVRISNSRAFFRFGILARAAALSATSMSARMTPGSS